MEKELEQLITQVKNSPGTHEDLQPLYNFFSKVIQQHKTLDLTPKIKMNIPYISSLDNGQMWAIAQRVIPHNPEMIIPQLRIPPHFNNSKRPKHYSFTPRDYDSPAPLQTQFISSPTITIYRPIMTTRDIIPTLARNPGSFYFCTKKNVRLPSNLSYKIHNKQTPPFPLTKELQTITKAGIFFIDENRQGEFMTIDHYLETKESLFLASQLPLFMNWKVANLFLKWHNTLRSTLHSKSLNIICGSCPFGHTEFFEHMSQIRHMIDDTFNNLQYSDIKKPSDAFQVLDFNMEKITNTLQECVSHLHVRLMQSFQHFCSQITDIELLLRADYHVLRTLGVLPQSLIPFSKVDSKNSSISNIQVRSHILFEERKKAYDRKQYLPRYTTLVKLLLRDLFEYHLTIILKKYFSIFLPEDFDIESFISNNDANNKANTNSNDNNDDNNNSNSDNSNNNNLNSNNSNNSNSNSNNNTNNNASNASNNNSNKTNNANHANNNNKNNFIKAINNNANNDTNNNDNKDSNTTHINIVNEQNDKALNFLAKIANNNEKTFKNGNSSSFVFSLNDESPEKPLTNTNPFLDLSIHKIEAYIDPSFEFAVSPSKSEFLEWFEKTEKQFQAIFYGEHLILMPAFQSQLFPDPDNQCPSVILNSASYGEDLKLLRSEVIKSIEESYSVFQKIIAQHNEYLRALITRLEEIESFTVEKYEKSSGDFVKNVSELILQRNIINSIQRFQANEPFYLDLKNAKSTLINRILDSLEKSKFIGFSLTHKEYEKINAGKDEFMLLIQSKDPKDEDYEPTKEEETLRRRTIETCLCFIEIAECMIIHWPESTNEFLDQISVAKSVQALLEPVKKNKKKKKSKKSKKDSIKEDNK